MSTAHPPYDSVPTQRCQRCGGPLFSYEIYCGNCGQYSAPVSLETPTPNGLYHLPQPAPQPLYSPLDQWNKRRTLNGGAILAVIALLVVLISGGVIGYIFVGRQTASSTALPTFTPNLKGPPLFTDSFTNNSNAWMISPPNNKQSFSTAIDNSAMTLEDDNNTVLRELIPSNKLFSNFQLLVDAKLSKGTQDNGYGVYIRGAANQNDAFATYYRFELYGSGAYTIFKGTVDAAGNLKSTILVDYTANAAIQKQDVFNHIIIVASGHVLKLVVNGQILSTVTDASYASGSTALFVSNVQQAPPGAQAMFAHLAIYPV